ncbi:hypothetical protein ACFQHO_53550 [Actinomadura yumaensis]|uniref:hypothetical protein n=1 Tax=Actinomadura yumaensis TaxID=111807 RepID=UPI003624519D
MDLHTAAVAPAPLIMAIAKRLGFTDQINVTSDVYETCVNSTGGMYLDRDGRWFDLLTAAADAFKEHNSDWLVFRLSHFSPDRADITTVTRLTLTHFRQDDGTRTFEIKPALMAVLPSTASSASTPPTAATWTVTPNTASTTTPSWSPARPATRSRRTCTGT